jgi:O-acetyl-ADP-ribose deacetylase (regulator of RNase III)
VIKYKLDQDILQSNSQAIVNTVNTVGVMGKGLALKMKDKYPEMYIDYKKKCEANELKIGKLHYYFYEKPVKKIIINFPTKKDWRSKSKIEDIRMGLIYFAKNYQNLGIQSVAFPPLGCGNGGLNWKDVKKEMEKYLGDLKNIEINIYITSKMQFDDIVSRNLDALENFKREIADLISNRSVQINHSRKIEQSSKRINELIEDFRIMLKENPKVDENYVTINKEIDDLLANEIKF